MNKTLCSILLATFTLAPTFPANCQTMATWMQKPRAFHTKEKMPNSATVFIKIVTVGKAEAVSIGRWIKSSGPTTDDWEQIKTWEKSELTGQTILEWKVPSPMKVTIDAGGKTTTIKKSEGKDDYHALFFKNGCSMDVKIKNDPNWGGP